MFNIKGTVHKYGDSINTDYIISSRRKRDITDTKAMAKYTLEDVDSGFIHKMNSGDVLAAGKNFGCGSAMEVAVDVLQVLGIKAVLAKSFARSYYRNAINKGLLVINCDTDAFDDQDMLEINVSNTGKVKIVNRGNNKTVPAVGISIFLLEVIKSGGIINYIYRYGDL